MVYPCHRDCTVNQQARCASSADPSPTRTDRDLIAKRSGEIDNMLTAQVVWLDKVCRCSQYVLTDDRLHLAALPLRMERQQCRILTSIPETRESIHRGKSCRQKACIVLLLRRTGYDSSSRALLGIGLLMSVSLHSFTDLDWLMILRTHLLDFQRSNVEKVHVRLVMSTVKSRESGSL